MTKNLLTILGRCYRHFFNRFLLCCKRVSKIMFCFYKASLWPWWYYAWPSIQVHLSSGIRIISMLPSTFFLTCTIWRTSREKIHQQLDLESLQLRKWFRELWCFVKIYNSKSSDYFLILTHNKIIADKKLLQYSSIQSEK